MKKYINCKDCEIQFEIIVGEYHSTRKLCDACRIIHINKSHAENSRVRKELNAKRKKSLEVKEKFYGRDDMKLAWDEPNILGY